MDHRLRELASGADHGFGNGGIDEFGELQDLLMPAAGAVMGDLRAPVEVERGEQVGGAVTDIVVVHPPAWWQQQQPDRGATVQRLNLALRIDRRSSASSGGAMYRPTASCDVTDLVHELWVRSVTGQLPGLHHVRFNPNTRQIRDSAVWLNPVWATMERVDH